MELWDGYNRDGTLANIELVRGEKIPQGLYHLVCEVLVQHIDGDYLLMQRDLSKSDYGGYYEATAGGSALKGEDCVACARRELFEETGISEENFKMIEKFIYDKESYLNAHLEAWPGPCLFKVIKKSSVIRMWCF